MPKHHNVPDTFMTTVLMHCQVLCLHNKVIILSSEHLGPILLCFRYYKIGVLVLFLHDINDVILEFTKLCVAFKSRGGKYHLIPDMTSFAGFLTFASLW